MTKFGELRQIRPWAAMAGLIAAVGLTCGQAQAQTYIRADCRQLVSAPRLDPSPPTARWYKRFWTGDCDGLRGCLNGSPNWNEVVGKLVDRSRSTDRPLVLAKACRLGSLIGQEWTRPRNLRRIDSDDLGKFRKVLESAGDVPKGIESVEAQVRGKIGRSQDTAIRGSRGGASAPTAR